jgi:hypothetical protein
VDERKAKITVLAHCNATALKGKGKGKVNYRL